MAAEEMELTSGSFYAKGTNIKKKYSFTAYNNLDIYQINCTYYCALGDDDKTFTIKYYDIDKALWIAI